MAEVTELGHGELHSAKTACEYLMRLGLTDLTDLLGKITAELATRPDPWRKP